MLIAVPAFRVSCSVGIDKGRAWSVVEEVLLWACTRKARTIADLAGAANIPRQVVVAALARLMRFRLVEVLIGSEGACFQASAYGRDIVANSLVLPFFPKREKRRTSFVIERATGSLFPTGQVRIASATKLKVDPDPEIREVVVTGGAPTMTHEANFARLSEMVARGWDERLAFVDGRTAAMREEFMLIRVIDGVQRDIPESATDSFREIVRDVARRPPGATSRTISVAYRGPGHQAEPCHAARPCAFDPADVVVGGSAQRALLTRIVEAAATRVILHSTFLDHSKFQALLGEVRAACARGVTFDLLWGTEPLDDSKENRSAAAAVEIAKTIREDADLRGRFRIHMRTTGSHAKLLLADDARGEWIAAVGSCNWLSTPFNAVEMTAVLRDPHTVADAAVSLQRMVGRRGLTDEVATEMAFLARTLLQRPPGDGPARVTLTVGDAHAPLMRRASGEARSRVVAGTHRLGSTARPGMIMPAEAAVERAGVAVDLLYTIASGPIRNRHARDLAAEAAANGVRLRKTEKPPLHAKFVAWDGDDVVVTSMNWGSATDDGDFPEADVGVHVHAPGIGAHVMAEVDRIFPFIGKDVAVAKSLAGDASKAHASSA